MLLFLPAVRTRADSWGPPVEFDVVSDNGKFVAHITPFTRGSDLEPAEATPRLEVFSLSEGERRLLWRCRLSNPTKPIEARVSDDGQSVVTFDNHFNVGYGDGVVAIYGPDGQRSRFSLEAVLGVSEIKHNGSRIRHSTSSRWWRERSFDFFDQFDDRGLFCLWVHHHPEWLCWDLTTGEQFKPATEMTARWNARARELALRLVNDERLDRRLSAFELLGRLRQPEDRKMLEAQLARSAFSLARTTSERGEYWTFYSDERRALDGVLAKWRGLVDEDCGSFGGYCLLGRLKGTVGLPSKPAVNDGPLWLYLIPAATSAERWVENVPEHVMRIEFTEWVIGSVTDQVLDFEWEGVLPGEYWLKVVWDRNPPLAENNTAVALPEAGDYVSTSRNVFEVEPHATTHAKRVDCDEQVVPRASDAEP